MSFYVKRTSKKNPAGYAYVGPIVSESQANKEAETWKSSGETVEVLSSSPEVKRDVRRWAEITHADDASEIVTYRGQQMTLAFYRLNFVERIPA